MYPYRSKWWFALFVMFLAACSRAPKFEQVDKDSSRNLITLHQAFVAFDQSQNSSPSCREDLEDYLPKEVTSDIFVSPRDGKEYMIRWGTRIVCDRAADLNVIAFEVDGKNGRRFVMTDFGVVELTDKDFDRLGLR